MSPREKKYIKNPTVMVLRVYQLIINYANHKSTTLKSNLNIAITRVIFVYVTGHLK